MLFLPVDETVITTSTLFPHKLQWRPIFFEPALAATSVFDFPAIVISSFQFHQFIYRDNAESASALLMHNTSFYVPSWIS